MSGRRELRRFPKGERCQICRTHRWYSEGGFRYCKNGHQVEGYVEFELGDEDFGATGRVARKQKEVKEREKRALAGQAARDLYLECLQLTLRKQILWLIKDKGHKQELETVVRDLWDLRIRGSSGLIENESASDVEFTVFSSQTSLPHDDHPISRSIRAQSWAPERGSDWPLPRLADSLALCVLGCALLRIPTRIGDFVRWAKDGNIVYKRAYDELPREMCDRLPSYYTRMFMAARLATFDNGELHSATMDLALSFHLNYDMTFPPLNDVLMTLQYVHELRLPIEVVSVARRLPPILNLSYSFPVEKQRIRLINHPELLLVCILVIATKHCFPFEHSSPKPQGDTFFQLPTLIWAKWHEIMVAVQKERQVENKIDYRNATAEQITSMIPDELEEYFSQIALLVDKKGELGKT